MPPEDHDIVVRLDQKFSGFLDQWKVFMDGPGAARCVEQSESLKAAHKRLDEMRTMIWGVVVLLLGKVSLDWLIK